MVIVSMTDSTIHLRHESTILGAEAGRLRCWSGDLEPASQHFVQATWLEYRDGHVICPVSTERLTIALAVCRCQYGDRGQVNQKISCHLRRTTC